MESLLSWPTVDATEYSRTDIVRWWEGRRLHFNVYVGVVGVVTWFLVLITGSAAVKPGVDFEEPLAILFGPVIYAIVANVCYTGGWIVDTLAFQGEPRVGLYKAGVVFSVSSHSVAGCLGSGRMGDNPNHRAQTGLIVEISPLNSSFDYKQKHPM